MFKENIKLLSLKTLSYLFKIPFVRGRITISEFVYKFLNLKSTMVKMKICDSDITLDLSDQQVRYIYFNAYEPAERRFLHKFLKNGDVFVDVGANYGYLSAIALCIIGREGKVYAFEPNPIVFECLDSLTMSAGGRFLANQAVISNFTSRNKDEAINFYINRKYSMLSSTLPEFAGHQDVEVFSVDAITLNDFFASNNIEKVGLIKIDVEGSEADVLEGLIPFLKDKHKSPIICEISPSRDDRWLRVIEHIYLLQDLGYELYDIDATGNISPISIEEIKERTTQSNVFFATKDNRRLV